MSVNSKILLEGTYLFFEGETNYSQENFKLIQLPDLQQFRIDAEILARVETGEFLKILVRYEMNHHYIPFHVKVEKSLGTKLVSEIYNFDTIEQELKCTFQNSDGVKEFERPLNARQYLTTPAFSTSTFFSLSKKFDQTGRTSLTLISSQNEWDFIGPLQEKVVYGEFMSRDDSEFKINGKVLEAQKLCLFEHSSHEKTADEVPTDIFISNYHGIPYELTHGDQKITMKNLKKNY
jgi:hypothetical protein